MIDLFVVSVQHLFTHFVQFSTTFFFVVYSRFPFSYHFTVLVVTVPNIFL